jgi:hypothetical protein
VLLEFLNNGLTPTFEKMKMSRDHTISKDIQKITSSRGHRVTAVADGEALRSVVSADRGMPLDLLFDRASMLAQRAKDGSLPFIDAVDMAYSAADLSGLVERYGDDAVQMVLADAFGGRP